MKLKDLLNNRDKLAKYDELKEWEEYFDKNVVVKGGGVGIMYSVKTPPRPYQTNHYLRIASRDSQT